MKTELFILILVRRDVSPWTNSAEHRLRTPTTFDVPMTRIDSLEVFSPRRPQVGLRLAHLLAGPTAGMRAEQQYQRISLE